MKQQKKVVKKRAYTIEEIVYDDNSCELTRTNDGFDLYEILALTTIVQNDMHEIIRKRHKTYTKITRQMGKPKTE